MNNEEERKHVQQYSQGLITSNALLDRLGLDGHFGDVLGAVARHNLTLPKAPLEGRDQGFRLLVGILGQRPPRRAAEPDAS